MPRIDPIPGTDVRVCCKILCRIVYMKTAWGKQSLVWLAWLLKSMQGGCRNKLNAGCFYRVPASLTQIPSETLYPRNSFGEAHQWLWGRRQPRRGVTGQRSWGCRAAHQAHIGQFQAMVDQLVNWAGQAAPQVQAKGEGGSLHGRPPSPFSTPCQVQLTGKL